MHAETRAFTREAIEMRSLDVRVLEAETICPLLVGRNQKYVRAYRHWN